MLDFKYYLYRYFYLVDIFFEPIFIITQCRLVDFKLIKLIFKQKKLEQNITGDILLKTR